MRNFLLQMLRDPTNLRRRLALTYTLVTSIILLLLFFIFLFTDNGGFENLGENTFIFLFMSLAIITMVAIFGTLFGFIASRTLVKRIQTLDNAATQWSNGNFTIQVTDNATDEIGQLGQKLNSMAQQLDTLIEERIDLAGVEERTRIARELHDAVKQQLFASSMQISAARTIIQEDSTRADEILGDVEELVAQMQTELMALIHMLRPALLQEQGLAKALESYVTTWSAQMGITAEITLHYEREVSTAQEQALYRISQEALANIARHAQATQLQFTLNQQKLSTVLIIKDNGIGFDADQAQQGYGLQSMQERVTKLGGTMEINSTKNVGSTIIARL